MIEIGHSHREIIERVRNGRYSMILFTTTSFIIFNPKDASNWFGHGFRADGYALLNYLRLVAGSIAAQSNCRYKLGRAEDKCDSEILSPVSSFSDFLYCSFADGRYSGHSGPANKPEQDTNMVLPLLSIGWLAFAWYQSPLGICKIIWRSSLVQVGLYNIEDRRREACPACVTIGSDVWDQALNHACGD